MWNTPQHTPLIHVKIWINLKIIKLSKRSQSTNMIPFT